MTKLEEIKWFDVRDILPEKGRIVMVVANFQEEGADIVNYCMWNGSEWQSFDFFNGHWYSLDDICTVTNWAEPIKPPASD